MTQRFAYGATGMRPIEGDGYGQPTVYVRAHEHDTAVAEARAEAYAECAQIARKTRLFGGDEGRIAIAIERAAEAAKDRA